MNFNEYSERMQEFAIYIRLDSKQISYDTLTQDIKQIKKTLNSWTKVFTQIMELQIQNSKSQNQNTILIQEILSVLPKPKKTEQFPISPIRKMVAKTEPDEHFKMRLDDSDVLQSDNLQNILNNPKNMSIVNFQGTPFDSAYESINREMQQLYQPDENQQMRTEQSSDGLKQFNKSGQNPVKSYMDGCSLPQSAKNNQEKRQFVFNSTKNLPQFQDQKENVKVTKSIDMKKLKVKEQYQKLSTVMEEVSALQNSQFCTKQVLLNIGGSQNIVQSCQNRNNKENNCFEFQIPLQSSVSKTPNNNTKPQNYFIENTRSGSKSLYQNNINTMTSLQIAGSNTKVIPVKYEQISSRAKSFSDQNSKRHQSKKCLDLELLDRQYENSQEILKKTNTLRKNC